MSSLFVSLGLGATTYVKKRKKKKSGRNKGEGYTGRITGVFPEPTDHVLCLREEVIAAGGEIEEMDFMHDLK